MGGRVGGIADWPLPGSRKWYRMVHCREGLRLPTKNNTSARHTAVRPIAPGAPNSGRLCAPRRETRCARASCASAGRVRATHSAGISFHTQRKLSHDTHCERGSREGSPSDFMGRLDAWRSAAWRVCRLKRRLLHGPRRCPQSRSPAHRPRALVGLAVDDIWSGEADNLSERGAR
jgi:hypothetical protein